MRRLHPDPGPVDARSLIAGLQLAARAPARRPYTIANFISSVDGRASVGGGSTGLGDPGDREVFRALRGSVDAVLAGTGTLAAEGYGRLARHPTVVELRRELGLPAQPLAVTVTRSGTLPDFPLLHDPEARLIVYSGAELGHAATAAEIRVVVRDPAQLSLAAVAEDLRVERGVRVLLCEGGPRIFGELVAHDTCDELFLTLTAKLAGGDGGPITRGLDGEPLALALLWALEQDGSLYLRYALGDP